MSSNNLYLAALNYARNGIPVFPLEGKRPAVAGGFYAATTDVKSLEKLWRGGEAQYNIGFPTGHQTKIFCLDIDQKPNGPDGIHALTELIAKHEPLPETIIQETGYGKHIFFACEDQEIPCSVGKIAKGIDVRGNGGYIVAAPSVHPLTGKPYRWAGTASIIDKRPTPAPKWLLEEILGSPRKQDICAGRSISDVSPCYGEIALAKECKNIENAPNGEQEATLNRSGFRMGQLVAAGILDKGVAVEKLTEAGSKMPSYNLEWPWTRKEIDRKIQRSVNDGMKNPRNFCFKEKGEI